MTKVILLGFVLIALTAISTLYVMPSAAPGSASLQSYANQVRKDCSEVRYRPACYEKEIPALTDLLSMQQVFDVVRLVQQSDPTLLHCHTLGHDIADNEVKKNPGSWKDVIANCPDRVCNEGCMHGALMAHYGVESFDENRIAQVKQELTGVCSNAATDAGRAICNHGLGHLFMYITSADIPRSLELCDFIAHDNTANSHYVPSCIQGVFMTIYQPLGVEAEELVKSITPKKSAVPAFCAPYSDIALESCRNESWILSREDILKPDGLTAFCSYSNNTTTQERCYDTVLNNRAITWLLESSEVETYETYCQGLSGSWKEYCFMTGAQKLVQADLQHTKDAVALCQDASVSGIGESCFEQLSVYFPRTYLKSGSEEYTDFCTQMPASWRNACLKHEM
ncbi:MAG: hypothetical protein Q7S95_03630 [bacterium]|nr:hypothetical protein [bacterium]